ncbi:alpha/beta hydrolase [Bacillus songklensis]|uniref:Alpha/beta hydrolase n=1 Tax=Bacillus songklensis TaxID=1069116 RepID=A0ABV8B5H2_9BACI
MEKKIGQTEELSFYSAELDETISLIVYLPASFSPLYKYSLLLAQDGQDYYTLGRMPRLIEHLLDQGSIPNTIFVGIPYRSIEDRREKYHPDGAKQNVYIRFLAHELVPFLDSRYPTYQMGQSRILMGDSLAGTVSLKAALTYPHTFGKVIMQSPFVNDHLLDQVKAFKHPSLLEMYHIIGQQETGVRLTNGTICDFLTPNRELHRLLDEKRFNVLYEEFAGNHSWTYWQPDLKRALSSMLSI